MNMWMPSNGTEFQGFQERYCFYCENEEGDGYCSISDKALGGEQPKEWTEDENFKPHCSGYVRDETKWERRNIAICHKCEKDINMLQDDYKYLCLEVEPDGACDGGLECSYYCEDCVKQIGKND